MFHLLVVRLVRERGTIASRNIARIIFEWLSAEAIRLGVSYRSRAILLKKVEKVATQLFFRSTSNMGE